MKVVYVNEYQPSAAKVVLGDPIYKQSTQNQRVTIRPIAAAPPVFIAAIIAGVGLTALILIAA